MAREFKETMTSRERFAAAVSAKPFDRIPVHLLISDHAARVIGVTVGEYNHSAALMARGQAEAFRKYGHDVLNVGPGLAGIPEALGCRISFPDGTPFVAESPVKSEKDLERIKVPDPHRDARLPLFIEAAVLLRHKIGNEALVSMTTSGPFTTAAHVRGTDQFLRDLRRNPCLVYRLLRIATDSIIAFARAAAGVGVRVSLADPTASGTMISAAQFREFALPYLTEVVRAVEEATGGPPALHICGNTSTIWKEMADTGAGVLSLDNAIDLAQAKAEVGNRAPLLGNIHPTDVMYLGKPDDVLANARGCLAKAWDTPKGYVLGLGAGSPSIHHRRTSWRWSMQPGNTAAGRSTRRGSGNKG